MTKAVVICVFVNVFVFTVALDLPPNFPRCSIDDPNLNKCMVKAANAAKPFLVRGLPELGVLPITPYIIPEVTLQQGTTSSTMYKAQMFNTTILGLDSYEITQFDYDVPNSKFLVKTKTGPIYMTGIYSIRGRLLTIPLEGQGQFRTNITNGNSTLMHQSKFITKHGVKYMQPVSTTIKFEIGNVVTDLDGLFDGNEVLSKATKKILKDNIQEIVQEMSPVIEEVLVKLTEDLLFKVTAKIPYEKLYPRRHH